MSRRKPVDRIEEMCNCAEWHGGLDSIDGFIPGFSSVVAGWRAGAHYAAILLRYCPWCGRKLRRLDRKARKGLTLRKHLKVVGKEEP